MKKYFLIALGLSIVFLLSNCASTYKPLNPDRQYYSNKSVNSEIEFYYKYSVLREQKNKKYTKKEDKKAIHVVAIKIKNNSSQVITLGENAKIYAGEDSELALIDPNVVYTELKQGVGIYALYLLLLPTQVNFSRSTTNSFGSGVQQSNTSSFPLGIILGPGLALGNGFVAYSANQKFKNELLTFNLIGKKIQPKETVYGLIGIRDTQYSPLILKVD